MVIDKEEKEKLCFNCVSYDRKEKQCVINWDIILKNKKLKDFKIYKKNGELFLCKLFSKTYNKYEIN